MKLTIEIDLPSTTPESANAEGAIDTAFLLTADVHNTFTAVGYKDVSVAAIVDGKVIEDRPFDNDC